MSYRNLTNISVTLQNVGVTRLGFGTPLFASSHRYFPERVRQYTSLRGVAEDIPVSSPTYRAAQGYFSMTPAPSSIKIGRREADLTLTVATNSTSGSLTVFVNDGNSTHSVNASVSNLANGTAVAAALVTAIENDSNVGPLVVASATSNTISLDVAAPNVDFWIKNLSNNISDSYTTSESATELLAAITLEDDDFYFFSAEDHSQEFVLAAAQDIEARTKMYFVSLQDVGILTSYNAGSATDTAGKLADSGFDRTKVFFHHLADTVFPETVHVASNAPFDAGSVVWANIRLPVPISQNPVLGRALTVSEKSFLEQRNVAYVERIATGGVTVDGSILRNNRVASGEWISNIRGRDNMAVDLEAEYTSLLLSQRGSKIPYSDEGVSLLKNACRNVLERYVLRNFIKSNYILDFLPVSQMSTSDRSAGVYNGGSFRAELQQGILFVDVSGTLSLNLGQ